MSEFSFHLIPQLPNIPMSGCLRSLICTFLWNKEDTKATNLICNVVVYQNSCFIGYHGYQWYQYIIQCQWHVRILISLDTMATKATNLICNVVVYQNSCFIGYHGYQWYQYVFFPIKPFCLRFYRNRVSVFRVQMSNIKASNPRLLSYLHLLLSTSIKNGPMPPVSQRDVSYLLSIINFY